MKYLKPYILFENISNSDLESDVKDMFLELEDLGYQVDIEHLEKFDQYLISIKNFQGYLKPIEIDNYIIDCILRLKEFAPNEGYLVDIVSINHRFHKYKSEDVNITDEGFFIKSVYGAPFQPDEVKVDYPIMWISIKLKKI